MVTTRSSQKSKTSTSSPTRVPLKPLRRVFVRYKAQPTSPPKETSMILYKAFYYGIPPSGYRTKDNEKLKAWYGPYQLYAWDTPSEDHTLSGLQLTHDGEVKLCGKGYHGSTSVAGALFHYNPEAHKRMKSAILERIRVYKVTTSGLMKSEKENVPYATIRKYAVPHITIGEEVSPEEVQKALEPVVHQVTNRDGVRETSHYLHGALHREEALGPAVIQETTEKVLSFQYKHHGNLARFRGPISGVASQLTFSYELLWNTKLYSTFTAIAPPDFELADACAPEHEWEGKTCGAGDCWQWNHNPQRYGLGHTQPPKEMFTRRLRDEFQWCWHNLSRVWTIHSIYWTCSAAEIKPFHASLPTNEAFFEPLL